MKSIAQQTEERKHKWLRERVRKYFDFKTRTKKVHVPAPTADMVEVPITFGFNYEGKSAGVAFLSKDAANAMRSGMVLSPAYQTAPEEKLLALGLVPAQQAVPDDLKSKAKPRNEFIWYLFLIAVVSGLLAIIALIVRLNYVKGI